MGRLRTFLGISIGLAAAAAAQAACGGDDDSSGGGGAFDGSPDAIAQSDGAPPGDGGADALVDGGKADEVCSADGWCWANPLPQGNPLRAVWAASPTNAWAVGAVGTLMHWDGAKWVVSPSGTTKNLRAIWGSGPTDIYVGGEAGTLLHFDGAAWSPVTSGETSEIDGIWGSGATDVWIVGNGLRHWDGTKWTQKSPSGSFSARSLWGTSASDVWAVGSDSSQYGIAHWDGKTWTTTLSLDGGAGGFSYLTAVWASGPKDAWAVGTNGEILRWDGLTWSPSTSDTTQYLNAVWGAGSDVWAAAIDGTLHHWNGSAWSLATTSVTPLAGLGGTSAADAWAVGEGGVILHGTGATWTNVIAGTTSVMFSGAWGAAPNDIWAVGSSKPGATSIWHFDGASWKEVPSPPNDYLEGIWGASANDIWVGGEPQVLRWNGATWSAMDAGKGSTGLPGLRGVWGFAANDVYGPQGPVRHWNGTGWSDTPSYVNGGGNDIWGSGPNDLWAVGESGDIVHWDGGTWGHDTITNGLGAFVRNFTVMGSGPNDVWAGTTEGMYHWDGGTWSRADDFEAVALWVGAPNDAYGVDYGGAIEHWDGVSWKVQASGTKNALVNVWGTATDVWAVGQYGTILRHKR